MLGAAPIPVNIAKEPTSGFGPLKAVLETISTVHSNHEVRSRSPVYDSSLMAISVGNCRRQKQD